MSAVEAIQRASGLIKTGKRAEAREVLKAILAQDKNNPFAWALMVQVAESRQEAAFCLKQVLRLRPGDAWATERLLRLESAPPQPAPEPPAPPVSALRLLRPLASPDTATPIGDQQPVSSASPAIASSIEPLGTIQPESQPAGTQGKTVVPRSFSLLVTSFWIFIGVVVVVLGVWTWNEYFTTRPQDREIALQAAREWTEASFRSDYGRMAGLACSRYVSDIRQVGAMSALVIDPLAKALGADLAAEPPQSITYEIVSIRGPNARVRVSGFLGEYRESLGQSVLDETIYIMKRENGQWKWCGSQ